MTTARADLRVVAPDGTPPWGLLPHVLARMRQAVKSVEGKLLQRAAARGTAALSARVDDHPVLLVCGYDASAGVLVVRVETESSAPIKIAALVFPSLLLVAVLTAWVVAPTPAGIAIGFVIGLTMATLVSWQAWATARERGVEGGDGHRVALATMRSALLASLRGAGLEVEERPSLLIGVDNAGRPSDASDNEDDALRRGNPDAWTRRMHDALSAIP